MLLLVEREHMTKLRQHSYPQKSGVPIRGSSYEEKIKQTKCKIMKAGRYKR